ncbi:MAG: AAA family ATPase [Planctomycetota bacterium]|jgi:pilus assembly protein CpaE
MPQDVRFIILNGEEDCTAELRSLLLARPGVKIIAEVEEPALLSHAMKQFPANAVLVNLDPAPDVVLAAVTEVIGNADDMAVFATSSSTDGPLILKAMRMGVREFFPKPIDEKALADAIEKVAAQCGEGGETGTLITVMGTSGGVGATTFSTNLAAELAGIAEGRVAIVDLDYRFGQVATFLDVEPKYTVADLCSSPEQLDTQVIEQALVRHESGLYVLARPASLAQADTITAASCVGLLSALLQTSEYVITDGPTRSDPNAKSVLDVTDANLLLLQLLVPTVRNAARIIEGMRDAGINLGRTRLICNRIGREAASLTIKDVAETLALKVFATIPDDWTTVSGAINLGETLRGNSPKSKVRQAIEEIAKRLHAPDSGSDDDDKDVRKRSLLGRILANS